ncbi:MAG TPA: universal stress protein [Bacteroidia bacterium]
MKKILVPTDFSKGADSAIKFAMALAKKEKAKIVLIHAFDISKIIPYMFTPSLMIEKDIKANEQSANIKLRATCYIIRESKIECEYINKEGSAISVILETIKESKPDLVIMGTKGASGIKEILMGSQTASIIEKAKCPVIAVPENATFKGIKKIMYATDYNKNDIKALQEVVEIATLFNARITVLHVSDEEFYPFNEKAYLTDFKNKVEKRIKYKKITYKLAFGKHLTNVIEKQIQKASANLLAMSTRHRNLIEKIFDGSVTKKMAFHTRFPLMVFHHKKN